MTRLPLLAASRAHLEAVGETWLEHLRFATTVSLLLVGAGLACFIHALVPALFPDTASRTVRRLHAVIEDRHGSGSAALRARAVERAPFAPLALLSLATAAVPWWAGAGAVFALPISLLSLSFPLLFLLTEVAPARDARD